MRRLIQLLKIIFFDKICSAQVHYQHPELISHYKKLVDFGLHPDEVQIFNYLRVNNINKILIYGAGCGRECKVVAPYVQAVVGFEPVTQMVTIAFEGKNIRYITELSGPLEQEFDVIWITTVVISFLTKQEREILFLNLKKWLTPKGVAYIKPDIMKLSYTDSFRYKLASDLLRAFKSKYFFEKGDTIRVNLDLYVGDEHFVFYHYFDSALDFQDEALKNGFKSQVLELGYFELHNDT